MDLVNADDPIDWHGMWQMLTVYGVGGKLLKAVQSFYIDRAYNSLFPLPQYWY